MTEHAEHDGGGDAPAFCGAGVNVTGNTGMAVIPKPPRTPRGGVPTVGGAGTCFAEAAALL